MLEIVTGTSALNGATEITLATLTAWHPLVDVWIDATTDPNLADAVFKIYAVTPSTETVIVGASLNGPGPGKRLLANVPGQGVTIELRAISKRGNTLPVTAAISGYASSDGPGPIAATASAGPLASGATAMPITGLTWNPVVDAYVQGPSPAAGAEWTIFANLPGFSAPVAVNGGPFIDVNPSNGVAHAIGGCTSWSLRVAAVAGAMLPVTCSLVSTQLNGISGTGPDNDPPQPAVNVRNQGIALPHNPYSTIDVEGAGITASDVGGGVARFTVPGASAETQVLIFRPGVPTSAPAFATWAEIKSAIAPSQGAPLIFVDDSVAPAHVLVTDGVTDCKQATIQGFRSPIPTLNVDDGAQLLNVAEIVELTVNATPTAVSTFGFTYPNGSANFTMRGAQLQGGGGAVPMFATVPAGMELDLNLYEVTQILASGPVFALGGAGSFFFVNYTENSIFPDAIVTGPVGSFFFFNFDGSVQVPSPYTGFSGTYALLPDNFASPQFPPTTTLVNGGGTFLFDSFPKNQNYSVAFFNRTTASMATMPSVPLNNEEHEIKIADSVTAFSGVTINGNGFPVEDPTLPGTYSATVTVHAIGNYRYRLIIGTAINPAGIWSLIAEALSPAEIVDMLGPFYAANQAQTAWFIDPQNVSGTASDTNSGLTSTKALRTWTEYVLRVGTTSPPIRANTTFTFLSSHTDNSDPVDFSPLIYNSAVVIITGTKTQVWTGILAGVVAKNRATPQLLQATLPGGAAQNQLILNTTLGSSAFIYTNAGGANWHIMQPFLSGVANVSTNFGATEDNAWANTNAVTGYSLSAINFARLAPTTIDSFPVVLGGLFVTDCVGLDPTASGGSTMIASGGCCFVDCQMTKVTQYSEALVLTETGANIASQNCAFTAGVGVDAGNSSGVTLRFSGGVFGSAGNIGIQGTGWQISDDAIVAFNSFVGIGPSAMNQTYLETGVALSIMGTLSSFAPGPAVWGPGGPLAVEGDGRVVNKTLGTYTGNYLQGAATPWQIHASNLGSSVLPGAPTVVNGNITLTNAHLDAAAGVAGFGSIALANDLSGGAITNVN